MTTTATLDPTATAEDQDTGATVHTEVPGTMPDGDTEITGLELNFALSDAEPTSTIDIIAAFDTFLVISNSDGYFTGIDFSSWAIQEAARVLEQGSHPVITRTALTTGQDAPTALLFATTVHALIVDSVVNRTGYMTYFRPEALDPTFHDMLDTVFPDDTIVTDGVGADLQLMAGRALEAEGVDIEPASLRFVHTKASPDGSGQLSCAGHTRFNTIE